MSVIELSWCPVALLIDYVSDDSPSCLEHDLYCTTEAIVIFLYFEKFCSLIMCYANLMNAVVQATLYYNRCSLYHKRCVVFFLMQVSPIINPYI